MAKAKIEFVCTDCGAIQTKWAGQCPACLSWSTLEEREIEKPHQRGLGQRHGAIALADIHENKVDRIITANPEVDRVLGGGFAPGSLILFGGDPGIGKSTLLLQLIATLAAADHSCLYVSGEESAEQIKLRASRLDIPQANILVYCETNLKSILAEAKIKKPEILIIDSIQTVYKEDLNGTPGTVNQVRECTLELMVYAKTHQCITILVGHVTKEGHLAGPRMLEHMVDTVIYFEGDRSFQYRILRTIKNRFGPSGEIGVLEMTAKGLEPIANASGIFLQDHLHKGPGCVPSCTLEGTRAILFEFQSLVTESSYAVPQRVALGLDPKKLTILLALIEKFGGVQLGHSDLFASAAGGLKIQDPATDLALALSVVANFRNITLSPDLLVLGELGLGGEVRSVSQIEARLKEAARQGFKNILCPKTKSIPPIENTRIIQVSSLHEALAHLDDFKV